MDLLALKTFRLAVEEGNLTAAAKGMHITKSVASRRIQSLEEEVNAKLLNRTTRGVSTTDAGALLYERAVTILAEVEDAKQSIACADDELVGTLRLTAPHSFGDIDLKKPITAFLGQYPGLSMHMNLTDERVDIIGGGYDVGIRITEKLEDSSLVAKRLAPIHALVVASPAYLAEHGTPQTPDDLKNHECVFYSNMEAARQWTFTGARSTRSVRVKGRISCNSGMMQLEPAKAGLAIAAVPRFFVTDEIASGELVEVLPDYPRPTLSLYALYPERRLLPLKVRRLIDFLADWYSNPENTTHL